MSFPTSPTNNQIAIVNGIRYSYSSTTRSWTRISSGKYTASASAPTNPANGDHWFDTNNDILFEYIDDGTSQYWVDIQSLGQTGNISSIASSTLQGNIVVGINDVYSLGASNGFMRSIFANIITANTFTANTITANTITANTITTNAITANAITVRGNILPSANLTYNIGSTTAWFNTFYGISTQAQYADLAENYLADAEYQAGTVLIFGGVNEVTTTQISHDTAVAGIVSTNPAYLMNANSGNISVALTGRVPCLVQGPVNKGTVLVTSAIPGVATALDNVLYRPGCVVGKSLEIIPDDSVCKIEVVVGRF